MQFVCAGQAVPWSLAPAPRAAGRCACLIGGARKAAELDAVGAIDEGYRLALAL